CRQGGRAGEELVNRLIATVGGIIHAAQMRDGIAIPVGDVPAVGPGLARATTRAGEQAQWGAEALGDGRSLLRRRQAGPQPIQIALLDVRQHVKATGVKKFTRGWTSLQSRRRQDVGKVRPAALSEKRSWNRSTTVTTPCW